MSDPEQPIAPPSSRPQEQIPKPRRRPSRIVEVIHEVVRSELRVFSGPLPPPEILAKYNEAFPDCAERIVAMADNQANYRHELEKADLEASIILGKRGQIIGATLAAIVMLGGIYLLANDKSAEGLALITGDAVAFGGAFIYDRYQRSHAAGKTKSPAENDAPKIEND